MNLPNEVAELLNIRTHQRNQPVLFDSLAKVLNWLRGVNTGGGSVVGVTGNIVDNTDPTNPIVTQQQPDWNEADNTQPDFIKNKPTIPSVGFDTVNVDAAANFSAGVLTLPAGVGTHNVIILTTAAGGNITQFAGDIPQGKTFQVRCATAITNTLQTTVLSGIVPVGSIVSNGANFIINGDKLSNVVFQVDGSMVVHVSDSINL